MSVVTWPPEDRKRQETARKTVKSQFLARVWTKWFSEDFVINRDDPYVAVWNDRPLDFRMIKITSHGAMMDRCAIERIGNPDSYAVFTLISESVRAPSFGTTSTVNSNAKIYHFSVGTVLHYSIDPEDEMLIKLTL